MVLRLREELDAADAKIEGALKESEESSARFLSKAREEAEAREEGKRLLSRVDELEGDWIQENRPDLVLARSNTCKI